MDGSQEEKGVAQPDSFPTGMLSIFVYPPSDPIDYQSPSSALWSIFRIEAKRLILSPGRLFFINNQGRRTAMKLPYRSTIGHTLSCISCTLPNGESYENWVSLSSHRYTDTAMHLLVRDQAGLSFLFHNYVDGTLIRGDENLLRLVHYTGKRIHASQKKYQLIQPRYMAFHLSAHECAALRDMIDFYTDMSRQSSTRTSSGHDSMEQQTLYFSNLIAPYESYLHRKQTNQGIVGGGCAPFGVGLLKASGHHVTAYDQIWKRTFEISENLIGIPKDRISFLALLFGRPGKKWIHSGYPVRTLNVYDPELIWEFIGTLHDSLSQEGTDEASRDDIHSLRHWMDRQGLDVTIGHDTTLLTPPATANRPDQPSTGGHYRRNHQGRSIKGVVISRNDPYQKS